MPNPYGIASVREETDRGRERTEIHTRYCRPSISPDHCIETIIEQSASELRASKLLAVYLTPAEARRWAEVLTVAADEAETA